MASRKPKASTFPPIGSVLVGRYSGREYRVLRSDRDNVQVERNGSNGVVPQHSVQNHFVYLNGKLIGPR